MPTTPATGTQVSAALAAAIKAARTQLGVPYQYGAEKPGIGMDCSALVQWAFGQAGIKLPRVAKDQQNATTPVAASDARPGDLVFYGRPATHVGIYLGGGKMLAAPKTGDVVKIQSVYGTPSNYGRVTGSVGGPVTTGQEPVNGWQNWQKLAGVGFLTQVPGLTLDQRSELIGRVATGELNPVGGALDAASATASGITTIAAATGRAGMWMSDPHNWIRVAQVVVGGALVLVGVSIVAKPAAAPVADAAGGVVTKLPAGRALKAAAS